MTDHSKLAKQRPTFEWALYVSYDGLLWQRVLHGLTFHVCAAEMRHYRRENAGVLLSARQEEL